MATPAPTTAPTGPNSRDLAAERARLLNLPVSPETDQLQDH